MTHREAPVATLEDVRSSRRAALTVSEVSRVLELDPRTISGGIATGELPSVRIGRRLLIPREPFLAMFTAGDRK